MKKTYTFAAADAPVQEHMKGLVGALRHWQGDMDRQLANAKNQKDRTALRAWVQAYGQIIGIIENSNSI